MLAYIKRNLLLLLLRLKQFKIRLWELEKCAKYLDGVIYNLTKCIEEDMNILKDLEKDKNKQEIQEKIY